MIIKETIEPEEKQFTLFWDMHSGGEQKLEWSKIYVNLPLKKAVIWFQDRFGRNPYHITCTCCGKDYSISSETTLEKLSLFHRQHEFKNRLSKQVPKISYEEYSKVTEAISVEEYFNNDNVLYVEIVEEK